ncbi:MAG: FAD-dependent oxidoreductase [Acidobacteriota bacterium]
MNRIAVVGAGIAGMSAAYYLSRKYEVHLFEREPRLGGHTHTHQIKTSAGPKPIDTGFIVHNERTYPNLVRLLAELEVETEWSDMSFSVFSPRTGYEWSSRGLTGFFASAANFVSPQHYGLAADLLRFNRSARALLDSPDNPTLAKYVHDQQFGAYFQNRYLFPMVAAVWSTSPVRVGEFPAKTLVRFFDNHGFLSITDQPRWKVIKGGSSQYIPKLTAPYANRIHLNSSIEWISRTAESVHITWRGGEDSFDQVVFACHGDQVLPLLADSTPLEREVLSHFRTSCNDTILHTDERHLPRRSAARASWNCDIDGAGESSAAGVAVTYHMNRLQHIDTYEQYCVTLNAAGRIDTGKVLRNMVYRHPLYTKDAVVAQSRWEEISGRNRTHYCGAYWFYGFHEDGLNSALRVARSLGVEC